MIRRMLPRCAGVLIAVAVVAMATGCAPSYTQRQAQWRSDLSQGRITEAIAAIDDAYDGSERDGTIEVGDRDALAWSMERGSAAWQGGDFWATIRHMDRAAMIAEAHRPVALAREIGTYLFNDQVRTYDGWPHEHALIDCMRLLAHLELAQRANGLIAGGVRDEDVAFAHYERAVNVGRRLSLTLPAWIKEQGWSAYPDEAFGRVLGAATTFALPFDQRMDSDIVAADAALRQAQQAYRTQASLTNSAGAWSPQSAPRTLTQLWVRAGDAGEGAAARAAAQNMPAAAPAGHGSLLVLDLVGYCPQIEQLRFTLIAAHYRNGHDRAGREVRIGHFPFWVEGPGTEVIALWPLLPWPGEWLKPVAPGGLAVFGFEVPVYASPTPRSAPQRVELRSASGAVRVLDLEALADPEALARAELARRQPGIVIKTLIRAVSKQAGVAVLSKAAKDKSNVLGFATNLIGSLLATWSEQADLRSWVTIPSRIDGGLIDLPVGEWTIHVPGAPPRSVTIPAGRTAIIPVRTFRDPVPLPSHRR